MSAYQPIRNTRWEEISAFVCDACSLAAPATAYTATLLLTAATPFVTWCVMEQGWPMHAGIVFSRQAIDTYCTLENRGKSEGTRRNYRAILIRISEVLVPEEHAETLTPLSRKRIAAPYTREEMEQFGLWALGQSTAEKRRRAMLMLVLCAGAGLRSSDIAHVFPDDVTIDAAGAVVNIRGTNPRMVPVLREWEEWLSIILKDTPTDTDQPLWGAPNRTNASNLLSSFTQYTAGKYPRSDGLRATWIVTHLRSSIRIKELMRALGFDRFENLPRYLEYVASLDDSDYRRSLRGAGIE